MGQEQTKNETRKTYCPSLRQYDWQQQIDSKDYWLQQAR
jgi:hypothetical protein